MNTDIQLNHLEALARRVRYHILTSSTRAGSGHPTSSLSATELMVSLLFGGCFRYDPERPDYPNNDRLIFSKGHASPLLYSLWAAAGKIHEEELMTYRRFGSRLEGHPTVSFPYADAATGSLGQGLSIGVGMALGAKYLDKLPFRTYVLLGDSEMAEGSQWEAIQIAEHYALGNLVGIIDVNRLGQRGETMYAHGLEAYRRRIAAFGWRTFATDGHDMASILHTYREATADDDRPAMIIARTIKGKGVSLLEDRHGWHGKTLNQEQLDQALGELGDIDTTVTGSITRPETLSPAPPAPTGIQECAYRMGEQVATRKAFGTALARIAPRYPHVVCLDGEVSNSTKAGYFAEQFPHRFFQMYIAEQNMVGTALGLSRRGAVPFVTTFAAFLSRAFDQIRMSQYSEANLKFVGSHAGVEIGPDGPSQMGLEDIAMFRSVTDSVVLYPSDAVSTEKLVEAMASHTGMAYLRTTRGSTPVIYGNDETFRIGGSKELKKSTNDLVTIVAAGVTVHEALNAYQQLFDKGTLVRVIDMYSVKPLDLSTLREAADATYAVLTVEDHHPEGGIGEAISAALADHPTPVFCLAVRKRPGSGTTRELLDYEEISSKTIVDNIHNILTQPLVAEMAQVDSPTD